MEDQAVDFCFSLLPNFWDLLCFSKAKSWKWVRCWKCCWWPPFFPCHQRDPISSPSCSSSTPKLICDVQSETSVDCNLDSVWILEIAYATNYVRQKIWEERDWRSPSAIRIITCPYFDPVVWMFSKVTYLRKRRVVHLCHVKNDDSNGGSCDLLRHLHKISALGIACASRMLLTKKT